MKALKYQVGQDAPEMIEIEDELEPLQEAVGGYIETFPCGENIIICNEEGKMNGMQPNRFVSFEENGLEGDVIFGDFLVVGDDYENAGFMDFTGTIEDVEKFVKSREKTNEIITEILVNSYRPERGR